MLLTQVGFDLICGISVLTPWGPGGVMNEDCTSRLAVILTGGFVFKQR